MKEESQIKEKETKCHLRQWTSIHVRINIEIFNTAIRMSENN